MMPFRELEVHDSFLLDGMECDKVAKDKYLVLDELGDAESLHVADPNMMVELLEDEDGDAESLHVAEPNMTELEDEEDVEALEELESRMDNLGVHDEEFLCHYFFSTLLGLVQAAEEAGEEYMKTEHLRIISEFYLSEESSED